MISNCVYPQSVDSTASSIHVSLLQDSVSNDIFITSADSLPSDSLSSDSLKNPKKVSKNGLEHTLADRKSVV